MKSAGHKDPTGVISFCIYGERHHQFHSIISQYPCQCKLKWNQTRAVNQVTPERTYMYQIINGVRNPGRDKILILALTMGCDLDETQRLLTLGKRHKLYPKEDRDALIIYALANRFSLTETNELLSEKDRPILE